MALGGRVAEAITFNKVTTGEEGLPCAEKGQEATCCLGLPGAAGASLQMEFKRPLGRVLKLFQHCLCFYPPAFLQGPKMTSGRSPG